MQADGANAQVTYSSTNSGAKRKKKKEKSSRATLPFLLMLTPGLILLIINNYLPMLGVVMAFKQYRFKENFFISVVSSSWVGFKNFNFLFQNPALWETLRNTILYNLVFIALGIVIPVAVAIALNELWNQRGAKFYQSVMFLPYFLSWIIMSYLVFAIFQTSGALNTMVLAPLGLGSVDWYRTVTAWPPILVFSSLWRYTGYNAIFYLSALNGINKEYYEAAMIDGAKKRQQIFYITLPHLRPVIIILTILALGRIFNSDFGLFYNLPMSRSTLFPVTEVLDTFIYRSMLMSTDFGRPVAASFFQSIIGFITIIAANLTVRKIDPDSALF